MFHAILGRERGLFKGGGEEKIYLDIIPRFLLSSPLLSFSPGKTSCHGINSIVVFKRH